MAELSPVNWPHFGAFQISQSPACPMTGLITRTRGKSLLLFDPFASHSMKSVQRLPVERSNAGWEVLLKEIMRAGAEWTRYTMRTRPLGCSYHISVIEIPFPSLQFKQHSLPINGHRQLKVINFHAHFPPGWLHPWPPFSLSVCSS